MKLDRLMSGAFAVSAVALACGCSSTPAPKSATVPVSDAVAITQLMSAQLPGPSLKVGKTHLAPSDDDVESGASDTASESLDPREEKNVRPNDGSRRSGGFGTTK